ncbi:YVTN family beta-propeller repeat protein [Tropicimonas sp. IMCC34043]|uniref:YVTN family beta-propeller repeat protein n=1 Tax=Tropicimonas sp. IMCC34043 TaxID=2248760 RepID=UPI000E25A045|nr:YVTN family beta-propeller repeat protein [Tropicimonas sp. IMCC34043]
MNRFLLFRNILGGRRPATAGRRGADSPPLRLAISALALCLATSPLAAGEIWVSNEKDNTLSVIDADRFEVTRTIPTGERPRGITFSRDFSRLYICASDSDTVQVMDPETGEILHDLPSGEDPEQFVLHPDNRHLYIANENDAVTTVVDVETRKVVDQIDVGIEPEGMAVSPDGAIVVTTSETTNMAHWIDTETRKIVGNTLVDARPRHAEFVKNGSELWVSSEIGGTITVFDVPTQAEKAKIRFEVKGIHPDRIQPVGFELTDDEKTAFVALGPANHVAVVNAETYEVEDYILVGRRVWHMAFNGDKSRLFTTNGVSGDVTVIDVASREPIRTVKVGRFPWGAAYRP